MRKKNKHTISVQKSSSMIKKETTVTLSPARKSRTRTRKPKYLSLRLQISPDNTQQSPQNMPTTADDHRHQLDLFPLHPVEYKDPHDDNVAYFFSTVDGGATALTALLGSGASSSASYHHDDNNAATLSPESLTYAYGGQDSEEVEQQLVRTAMRNKAREPSEEKWVSCYSPGSVSDLKCKNGERRTIQRQRLSLKLDYEEIMNAWSDKGPLYIHVDSPQVVPDLSDDDFFTHHPSTNGWGWKVPEMSGNKSIGCIKVEEVQVQGGGEEWKMGKREASVLRYKEKRRNRLFSKKIRYQVRKLNAEKRPRIKGRFVKRN